MEQNNKVVLRKIPLEIFIDVLMDIYEQGVDFVDIVGINNEIQDEIGVMFTKEYVNAEIDTKRPRKNLHRTKSMKKDCYDRNNARNRCIYTREKAQGALNYTEDIKEQLEEVNQKQLMM